MRKGVAQSQRKDFDLSKITSVLNSITEYLKNKAITKYYLNLSK